MTRFLHRIPVVVLSALGLLPLTASALSYTLTDLGTLGGATTIPFGINDSGSVVGWSAAVIAGQQYEHAFLYSGGSMTDLGVLGGTWSIARGINNSGTVVGYSDTSQWNIHHAFSYSNGTMTDLGSGLAASATGYSLAYSVNSGGTVVGWANFPVGNGRPMSYSNGTMSIVHTSAVDDFENIGGEAVGINTSGTIAGSSFVNINGLPYQHAFSKSGDTVTDLGTLPGATTSAAKGINDSGTVVGTSENRPFLYTAGAMTDLLGTGIGGGIAEAINNSGMVVGYLTHPGFSRTQAFAYLNGSMLNLNDFIPNNPGWDLIDATAINSSGQIVGVAYAPGDIPRAYLLTPVEPVPEASTWVAGLGLAVVAFRQWCRKKG